MRKLIAFVLVFAMTATMMSACGKSSAEKGNENVTDEKGKAKITIAYQPSIGYAPLLVMKDQGLIEKTYDGDIEVEWKEMSNGAEINEALIAGELDAGCVGVPVAINGIIGGSPYKIGFGLSAQPYAVVTNKKDVKKLKDFKDEDQIAITNINSQPHILLGMWAKNELGDAHALDNNLTVLANPDGYTSLISGAVAAHMVISPFNFMAENSTEADIHEVEVDSSVWDDDSTALVGVVTKTLHDDYPEIYDALIKALEEADQYIADNGKEVADMLAESYEDATGDDIYKWMTDPRSSYTTELKNVMKMSDFMFEEGFTDSKDKPESISDLVYDNVKGE